MNLEQIKAAIAEGKAVHWKNGGYTVVKGDSGEFLIVWNKGGRDENAIGLTWRDGVTMNGQEDDFYLASEILPPSGFREFVRGYLNAAFWSSVDNDTPMDELSDPDKIDPDQRARIEEDCRAFILAHGTELVGFRLKLCKSWDYVGHDFWLTRCGHGTGFWDRNVGDVGRTLSDAVGYGTPWPPIDLYMGDDGKPYFSGFESYENKRGA